MTLYAIHLFKSNNLIRIPFSILFIVLISFSNLISQNSFNEEILLLRKDFPNLMKLYENKLSTTHADFVIAVDVSKSMEPFWDDVQQGMEIFLSSIPDGDYVSIIYFGETARLPFPPTEFNSEVREEMIKTLRPTRPRDNRTDLGFMLDKILAELNRPGGNELKFVFMFTDFWHVATRNSPYLRSNRQIWNTLRIRYEREQSGRYIETFALLLPLSRRVGQDIDLVRNVFHEMEEIRLNRTTLRQWFQRRRAEILRDRLRYLVKKEIRGIKPILNPQILSSKNIYLNVDWKDDILTKGIAVTSVQFQSPEPQDIISWAINQTPLQVSKKEKGVNLAMANCSRKNIFPKFVKTSLRLKINWNHEFKYGEELLRLNLPDKNSYYLDTVVNGRLTCGLIPIWALGLGILLIVLFSGCSLWSCLHPVYIEGRITVLQPEGLPINKTIIKEKRIQVGKTNSSVRGIQIPIQNTDWCWEMWVRKNCPCRLWKRSGVYGKLVQGVSARVYNPGTSKPEQISMGYSIYLERGCRIEISYAGNLYKILWE